MNGNPGPFRYVVIGLVILLAASVPLVMYLRYSPAAQILPGEFRTPTATANQSLAIITATPGHVPLAAIPRTGLPERQNNCTFSAWHWLEQPEIWPAQVSVGSLNYTQEEALRLIREGPVDVFKILFIQFHTAYLNVIWGADPAQITEAMFEASQWLLEHPGGSTLTEEESQRGLKIAKTLQEYNDGDIGPGRCPAEAPVPKLAGTAFLRAALSLTPELSLLAPSATPSQVSTRPPVRFPTFIPTPIFQRMTPLTPK